MAQERRKVHTVKSKNFRVIQGAGIFLAANPDEVVIQFFSEYPDFSPDLEQDAEEPTEEENGEVFFTSPTAMIREIEAHVTLPGPLSARLGEALVKIKEAQDKQKEETS